MILIAVFGRRRGAEERGRGGGRSEIWRRVYGSTTRYRLLPPGDPQPVPRGRVPASRSISWSQRGRPLGTLSRCRDRVCSSASNHRRNVPHQQRLFCVRTIEPLYLLWGGGVSPWCQPRRLDELWCCHKSRKLVSACKQSIARSPACGLRMCSGHDVRMHVSKAAGSEKMPLSAVVDTAPPVRAAVCPVQADRQSRQGPHPSRKESFTSPRRLKLTV